MSIRLKLWLGLMLFGGLLLAVAGVLTILLTGWIAAGSGTVAPALGVPLLVSGVLGLALLAPVAWLVAWAAYEPVRDVTRTARRIVVEGQLDGRCFYPGPLDDVGRLVVIMNEVLVRYDAALGRIVRLRGAAETDSGPSSPQDAADLVLDFEAVPTERPPSR
jgi:hypothetical protein